MPRRKPSADRILVSAEATFVRNGYGETSLRQLLNGAGVSTTAFYARFGSKEEVLRALVQRLLEELESRARVELSRADSLTDGFQRGAKVLFDVLAPKRALVRIVLTEAAASAEVTRALGALYAQLAAFLTQRFSALLPRDVDADALAWSIVGALNMQVLRWAVFDDLGTERLRRTLLATANAFLPALPAPAVEKKRATRPRAPSPRTRNEN